MIGCWMSTLTNIALKVASTAIIDLCATGVARVMGVRMGVAPTGGPTGAEDFKQVQIDYKAPSQYVVPNTQLPT
jgi:hypothetical protein